MEQSIKDRLPQPDWEYLDQKNYDYNIIPSGAGIYVLLKNFDFPVCYSPQKADLLIVIPPGYPNAPLDMFRTSPDVKLATSNAWPQTAQSRDTHLGKSWQVWSRHFIWRVGVDNLRSYLTAIKRELSKCV